MKLTTLLFAFVLAALPVSAQVYSVNLTTGGSGYTSAPTVTATGGSCTTEPTLAATIGTPTPAAVISVVVTYAGVCTPGGTAPTLAFTGGGGSGAAATALMIGGNIAILATPLVVSDANAERQPGGPSKLYRYECTLVPTANRVQFYSSTYTSAVPDRMPGTSQSSIVIWAAIPGAAAVQSRYDAAFSSGILTLYDGILIVNAAVALATVEANIVSQCAQQQTNLNAWNPWANYGTFYNGTTWTTVTIP